MANASRYLRKTIRAKYEKVTLLDQLEYWRCLLSQYSDIKVHKFKYNIFIVKKERSVA